MQASREPCPGQDGWGLLTDKGTTRGTRTGAGSAGRVQQVCVTGPGSPGRGAVAVTVLLSFSLLRPTSACQGRAKGKLKWVSLRRSLSNFTLSQPSETPTQCWETGWCGMGLERSRRCGGSTSCCCFGGGVGKRLEVAHTHSSPLTEHLAPTHGCCALRSCSWGTPGHRTPQGGEPLFCFPRGWAMGQHGVP